MRSPRNLWILALILSACALSGCGFAIGPQVETRYVILHPGSPLQVLENQTVTGRALAETGGTVRQDIGGWVAMPPDHWATVKAALEAKK